LLSLQAIAFLPRQYKQVLVRLQRAAFGLFLLGSGPLAWSDTPMDSELVTLHYIQRPPYMMADGAGLKGLAGLPSFLAFKKSGVPFAIKETPFVRQLLKVQTNSGRDCMIGLFKKPERELFAKYSLPIYKDQTPLILTSAANASKLENIHSVKALFSDKSLLFLVKLGYSYGVELDALIERFEPTIKRTADENLLMVKALKLKMADYMVIAPEEATEAVRAAGFAATDFRQIRLSDMPGNEYRHLMCSKNVPDKVIQQLNAAIFFEK
jgi:polar amino acid transport system substrate-binding protein